MAEKPIYVKWKITREGNIFPRDLNQQNLSNYDLQRKLEIIN